jgi:CRISP-associated protein Cas1
MDAVNFLDRQTDWAERAEFWIEEAQRSRPTRKRRERSSEVLTLAGHGMSLRVDAGTLLIKNGLTHYTQKREEFRYFRGDLNRPARIILLDGSGSISFDVLDWLAEQDIPLIRISWTGEVVTVAGPGYSADPKKVEWQRKTRAAPHERLAFSCELIRQKIENSLVTLEAAIPKTDNRDKAVAKLEAELYGLNHRPPRDIERLRGIEGSAGKAYFWGWRGVPLRWAANKRRPIPAEWHHIGPRSSDLAEKTSKNRNATHPINAMLNYAYAVLEAQVRIQTVSEGYDPTIGIMHHDYRGGPAFVLDKMEPLRPVADVEVLRLAMSAELNPSDFVLRSDGGCRINPNLGAALVGCLSARYSRAASRVCLNGKAHVASQTDVFDRREKGNNLNFSWGFAR